jgi:nanoRNase/pAp phosphatase (c-di-AMP/oligoRNAs hydrolase)
MEKMKFNAAERRLDKLLAVSNQVEQLTIVLHNNPDPDAIAAGAALKYLLEEKTELAVDIVYRGVIGRAENKALVQYLDIPMQVIAEESTLGADNVALIDTHPGASNHPLQEDAFPLIVIDHHKASNDGQAAFSDIRSNVGATSTIMTEYLQASGKRIPKRLSTALLYGIKTDTQALSRNASPADVRAYCYLSYRADINAFLSFEKAQVPAGYFQGLATAMQNAQVYDGLVISNLGNLEYPDLVAEIADLLLRLEGNKWVFCMGVYNETLYFSIRTIEENADVDSVAQSIAEDLGHAGGRDMIAGGQISLKNANLEEVIETIRQRILNNFGLPLDTPASQLVL